MSNDGTARQPGEVAALVLHPGDDEADAIEKNWELVLRHQVGRAILSRWAGESVAAREAGDAYVATVVINPATGVELLIVDDEEDEEQIRRVVRAGGITVTETAALQYPTQDEFRAAKRRWKTSRRAKRRRTSRAPRKTSRPPERGTG